MSAEDIKMVEETLSGLLTPDNNTRKNAEKKLEELQQNRSGLLYCLSFVLLGILIYLTYRFC